MNRVGKAVFAGSLVIALLAGPMAATCDACCPTAQPSPLLAAEPACCGDCAPTLDRTPDPASIAAQKAIADPGGVAPMMRPVSAPLALVTSIRLSWAAAAVSRDAVPASPRPLRL